MKKIFLIGNGESRRDYNLQNLRKYGKIYGCNAIYRDFIPDVLIAVDHGIMHEIYHAGVAQKIPCYFRDWTKVPAQMYESVIEGGLDLKEVKQYKDQIMVENERGDSSEFNVDDTNMKGIVDLIKRNGLKQKQNVNHVTIKVSWIKKPDYSHSLKDVMTKDFIGRNRIEEKQEYDHGWAAGPTSGYIACRVEKPGEVYLIGHDLHSTTKKVNNLYKGTKHYVHAENGPTPAVNWIKQWYTLFEMNPDITFIKVNQFNDGRDPTNSPIEEWEHNKKLPNVKYMSHSTLDNIFKT